VPRAERGGVRYLILEAIEQQPRHGYEIIQHIERCAGQGYRPSAGVIYPTLQLLEEMGHAAVVDRDGRKVYAITDEGKRDLEANRVAVSDFYSRFADEPWESSAEDLGDVMRFVGRLVKTVKLGMYRGSLSNRARREIRKILEEALEKIEKELNGCDG
jgi:DNA-binding PadR family transcriptional regulator